MKTIRNILFAFALALTPIQAEEDCKQVEKIAIERFEDAPKAVFTTIDELLNKFPDCACEVVKAAIRETKASKKKVGEIVEAAIYATPQHMRMIVCCAIAVAPDARDEILKVYEKFAPAEDVEKIGAKCGLSKGKEVLPPLPNPLDKIFFDPEPPIIVPPVTDVRCRWWRLRPGLPPASPPPYIAPPPTWDD